MAKSIDDRVVAMSFENAKFEQAVSQTIASLTKLNESLKKIGVDNGLDNIEKSANKITLAQPSSAIDKLKAKLGFGKEAQDGLGAIDQAGNKVTLEGPSTAVDKLGAKLAEVGPDAQKSFTEIDRAAGKVSLAGVSDAISAVADQFTFLEHIAANALGGVATNMILKGTNFAKGFGIGPVLDGLHEYETNLKSIQTIQANTDRPLTEINRSLTELNHYSDQTIYNFSEMAKNIGTFTAAGVDLQTATSSIKGIANMAALSGSSSQQAATAMYQLSQAISSGRVGLQDWNSVVNAGMGGKKLQTALATTAIAMGDIGEASVKLEGPMKKLTINGSSFRESIMAKPGSTSWLSSEILVNTLATLDGRFSKAALSAELTKDGIRKYTDAQVEAHIATARQNLEQKNGVKYTDAQFKSLMKLSDSAFKSATEVKTLGQVFDVAKETIGSGWSASFQSIFGNLTEAKKTFTALSGSINGFINANALARNNVLHDWKAMGGRTKLIEGIKQAFHNLFAILKPIKDAFRDIFPAKTGKDLFAMTKGFSDLMKRLEPSKELVGTIRRLFAGLFSVLDIGKMIIAGVFRGVSKLFDGMSDGSGGVLKFAGNFGDLLVAIRNFLKETDIIGTFFEGLGSILAVPINLLGKLAGLFGGLFDGFSSSDTENASKALDEMSKSLSPLEKISSSVRRAWDGLVSMFEGVANNLKPAIAAIGDVIGNVGENIAHSLGNADFEKILKIVQVGLIGGIFVVIKKALKGGMNFDVGGGFLNSVKQSLDTVRGSLVAMQTNIKANVLLKIAGAVALIAVAVTLLADIDADKLGKAMTAIAVGFGELLVTMNLLSGMGGKGGFAKIPAIATGMLILAVAINVLAIAVRQFATLDWEELGKGLAGVAGVLVAVSAGMMPLQAASKGLVRSSVGLIAMGVALNIIAASMKIFATMSWEEMGRGLAGIAGALIAIGAAMLLMPPSVLLIGPGLIAVGVALGLIAGSVLAFGSMDLLTLGKGIAAIAYALGVIAGAMLLMPPTLPITAAGLILVGIALAEIAGAVAIMGSQDLGALAKGIGGIAAMLAVLAIGLTAMSGSLPGSAALLVAAAALSLLVPVIGLLGSMKWGTIFKGLGAIALVLGTLALAGAVAGPGLLILGAGLAALGAGMLVIGAAVYLLAKGLALLGQAGVKGVAVMVTALTAFVALLPSIIIDFTKGLVEIINEIAKLAPQVVDAIVKIGESLVEATIRLAPKMATAATALITAILQVINKNLGPILTAGFKLLQSLLRGISNNIGRVTEQVGDIVIKFLGGLTKKLPEITAAGAKTLVSLLTGIANNLGRVVIAAGTIVVRLINGISNNLSRVTVAGANLVIRLLAGISSNSGRVVSAGVSAVLGFLNGIADNIRRVVRGGVNIAIKLINAVANETLRMADEGAKAVIRFLNGLAEAIRKRGPELRDAGWNIADAIIDGIIDGFVELKDKVVNKAKEIGEDILSAIKNPLKVLSPSKETYKVGKYVVEGLANGLSEYGMALSAANALGIGVIDQFRAVFGIASPSKVMHELGKFVGKGFADGLVGSKEDIDQAFAELRQKMNDTLNTLRSDLSKEKQKLKAELSKEKKNQDKAEIAESTKAIHRLNALIKTTVAARGWLVKGLSDQRKLLNAESVKLDDAMSRLDEANTALDTIIKKREDAIGSYSDQYSKLPEIDPNDPKSLGAYRVALQKQIDATAVYKATLDQLRGLGLDDLTYQKLLDEGVASQSFADQILAGGKAAVDGLNAMDTQLTSGAAALGLKAADDLYNTGIETARGLVRGIQSEIGTITSVMEKIADAMITAIKKKLKIKSPSREFELLGRLTNAGMAKGLIDSTKSVVKATTEVGDDALSAMRSQMARISEALSSEIDANPTITPVLDLTQIASDARKLTELTNVTPITAATSYSQAAGISVSQLSTPDSDTSAANAAKVLKFEQNNYSPTALTETEIYRRTNNLLSQAKRDLGLVEAQ